MKFTLKSYKVPEFKSELENILSSKGPRIAGKVSETNIDGDIAIIILYKSVLDLLDENDLITLRCIK